MYKRLLEIALRYVKACFLNNPKPSPVAVRIKNVQDDTSVKAEHDTSSYWERK